MEYRCSHCTRRGITVILAVDEKYNIGKNNELLFRIPTDLQNFKKITMGKNLYMGKNTFLSTGLLEGRNMVVLSRRDEFENVKNIHSLDEFLSEILNDRDAILIGGGDIIEKLYTYIDTFYLTEVSGVYDADTSIRNPNENGFYKAKESPIFTENNYNFKFVLYKKIYA